MLNDEEIPLINHIYMNDYIY